MEPWSICKEVFLVRVCVWVPGGFADQIDNIHPEAVDMFVEPELHDVVNRGAHRLVVPVKIWLLGEKHMQVILPGCLVPFPSASSKPRLPVVWWPPNAVFVEFWIFPDVPIPLGIVPGGPGFGEPWMLQKGQQKMMCIFKEQGIPGQKYGSPPSPSPVSYPAREASR